jgi:hypothetical protein
MFKCGGMFFRIELGILSGPGALLLLRFLRQKLYISWSKYVCKEVWGSLRLSIMYPSKSCHGYCRTPYVQCSGCVFGYWHVRTVERLLMDCCV